MTKADLPERLRELRKRLEGGRLFIFKDAELVTEAEQALSASQKEVEAKTQALIAAEGWFRDYAQQHRAKGTADGNLKAQTNEDRADHLRSALQTGGKEHG